MWDGIGWMYRCGMGLGGCRDVGCGGQGVEWDWVDVEMCGVEGRSWDGIGWMWSCELWRAAVWDGIRWM